MNDGIVQRVNDNSISINEVIFEMSSASYKISYKKGDRIFCEYISICKNDMKRGSEVAKEILDRYGSYTLQNIDINLYSALSKFDKKMNSNLAEDFARNGNAYPIEYQFEAFYNENSKLSIFDKIKIKNMANRNGNSSHKLSRILPVAIGMAIFVGSVFGILHQNHANVNDKKFSSRFIDDEAFNGSSPNDSFKVETGRNDSKKTNNEKINDLKQMKKLLMVHPKIVVIKKYIRRYNFDNLLGLSFLFFTFYFYYHSLY